MPMNHFSQNLPETIWWTQPQPIMEAAAPNTPSSKHKPLLNSYHHSQPPIFPTRNNTLNFNLNQDTEDEEDEEIEEEEEEEEVIIGVERQPMFEKPLTPSDVGKLNRLVIPKQHAEKYFPLGGDSGEKGLLLSFEDECGKCWRFRYSYWNISQSYVLTKGWSRFVKEKRLDAGDVVLFLRDRSEADRFFIGWRRRAGPPAQDSPPAQAPPLSVSVSAHNNTANPSVGWTRVFYSAHPYPSHPHAPPPLQHQPDCLHAGSVAKNQTPAVGNSKRLRLFGVNLECQMDESEPSTPDGCSSLSSQGPAVHHQSYPSSNAYNYMDINFSRDVNQMRDHRG